MKLLFLNSSLCCEHQSAHQRYDRTCALTSHFKTATIMYWQNYEVKFSFFKFTCLYFCFIKDLVLESLIQYLKKLSFQNMFSLIMFYCNFKVIHHFLQNSSAIIIFEIVILSEYAMINATNTSFMFRDVRY